MEIKETKICPKCGAENSKNAKFCKRCGESLKDVFVGKTATTEDTEAKKNLSLEQIQKKNIESDNKNNINGKVVKWWFSIPVILICGFFGVVYIPLLIISIILLILRLTKTKKTSNIFLCVILAFFSFTAIFGDTEDTESSTDIVVEDQENIKNTDEIVTEEESIEYIQNSNDNTETSSAPIEMNNTDDYIIADSGERYLDENDVVGLDKAQIRIAINEIYARHGRSYETQDLKEYFSGKSWYTPQFSADEFAKIEDSIFNDYEKENIKFLAKIRDEMSDNADNVSLTKGNGNTGTPLSDDWNIKFIYDLQYPKTLKDERDKVLDFLRNIVESEIDIYNSPDSIPVQILNGEIKRTLNDNLHTIYYGQLKDGKPDGIGIITGGYDTYIGNFKNGTIEGYGFICNRGIYVESEDFGIDKYNYYTVNGKVIEYYNGASQALMIDYGNIQFDPSDVYERLNKNKYSNMTEDERTLSEESAYREYVTYRNPSVRSELDLSEPYEVDDVVMLGNQPNSLKRKEYYSIYSENEKGEVVLNKSTGCYGQLFYEGTYNGNNEKDGEGVVYYPNGNIHYKGGFVENCFQGYGEEYYENGKLKYKGDFVGSLYSGRGTYYDENGNVIHEGEFFAGDIR